MATHSSILALRIPWTEGPGDYSPWGHKETKLKQLSTGHNLLMEPDSVGITRRKWWKTLEMDLDHVFQ